MKNFKSEYDLEKRREIYERQAKSHPNKIGIIAQIHPKSKLSINKYFKFMANQQYTIGSIQQTIKKELMRTNQISKNGTTSIYLFCSKKILKSSDVLKNLGIYKDQDNFVYLLIAEAETF